MLQFFGSTEERFKHFPGVTASTGTIVAIGSSGSLAEQLTTHIAPGPGYYNPEKDVKGGHHERKVNTAAFQSQRKDILFSGNDVPGPGQYSATNKGINSLKNW